MSVLQFPAKADCRNIWLPRVQPVALVFRRLHTTRARNEYLSQQVHAIARRLHRMGVPPLRIEAELAAFEAAIADAAKGIRE